MHANHTNTLVEGGAARIRRLRPGGASEEGELLRAARQGEFILGLWAFVLLADCFIVLSEISFRAAR
jgi:hypothetical protein